ncbi:MAG: hypothetical protein JNL90_11580 [Planctomycetes bacterium]|nr:hypothetical protein [Planctomycetota bacterium]
MSESKSLRRVDELYGRHRGADLYVVGTGASMRVFPLEFLRDKVTIGLNQAWKLLPTTYAITMRPELNVPEFIAGEAPRPDLIWITKHNKLTSEPQRRFVAEQQQRFFYFRTEDKSRPAPPPVPSADGKGGVEPSQAGRVLDWVARPTDDYLYLWTSISQSAVNLAANMGAKNVILVGCDNCALEGNHHAHEQHTFWKGADPDRRYHQYWEGLAEMRPLLRARGVTLLTLTPFLGLGQVGEDFAQLCEELAKPKLIVNEDITAVQQGETAALQAARAAERAAAKAARPRGFAAFVARLTGKSRAAGE